MFCVSGCSTLRKPVYTTKLFHVEVVTRLPPPPTESMLNVTSRCLKVMIFSNACQLCHGSGVHTWSPCACEFIPRDWLIQLQGWLSTLDALKVGAQEGTSWEGRATQTGCGSEALSPLARASGWWGRPPDRLPLDWLKVSWLGTVITSAKPLHSGSKMSV